jgi:phosphatidylserine synthase
MVIVIIMVIITSYASSSEVPVVGFKKNNFNHQFCYFISSCIVALEMYVYSAATPADKII